LNELGCVLKSVLREYSATTRSLQYSIRETALVLAADGSGTSLLLVPVATLRVKASPRRQGEWPIAVAASRMDIEKEGLF
jgi:hypothetical protein